MRAFRLGRMLVMGPVILVGLVLLALEKVDNAMNYTQVTATVETVDYACVVKGERVGSAADCTRVRRETGGGAVLPEVRVRYESPADHRTHTAAILVSTRERLEQIPGLRPGARWAILAHDDQPEVVK